MINKDECQKFSINTNSFPGEKNIPTVIRKIPYYIGCNDASAYQSLSNWSGSTNGAKPSVGAFGAVPGRISKFGVNETIRARN